MAQVNRDEWLPICSTIGERLAVTRAKWLESCEQILGKDSRKPEGYDEPVHAATAYQLWLTSGFLAQHGYVPETQGRDFADVLWAAVCGRSLERCLFYFQRYEEAGEDLRTRLFRFAADVAEGLTGRKDVPEAMGIAELIRDLTIFTHIAVAASFRDQETVAELQERLELQSQEGFEQAPSRLDDAPLVEEKGENRTETKLKNPERKKPFVAVILSLFFGPLGYLYIGWRYSVLAFLVLLVFVAVITVVDLPVMGWMKYFILPVLAWKGYTICTVRNELIEAGDLDQTRELNTLPVAVMAMSDLLVGIGLIYSAVVGLWIGANLLLEGNIFSGLAMVFFGTPALLWIASIVLGGIAMFIDFLVAARVESNPFRG